MEAVLAGLTGVIVGLSLVVAIGPQNAFVLRQGLAGRQVGAVVAVCVASDAALIILEGNGLGSVLQSHSRAENLLRLGGALFAGVYGAVAMNRALRHRSDASVLVAGASTASLFGSMTTCLAFTWLNPHVYLDTVVLLGTVAGTQGKNVEWFTAGAVLASVSWFTALGFGARYLRPLFTRPVSVRVLDFAIGAIMLSVMLSLVTQAVTS
jgi:L-lysine exporter family protein LysE/ArgO